MFSRFLDKRPEHSANDFSLSGGKPDRSVPFLPYHVYIKDRESLVSPRSLVRTLEMCIFHGNTFTSHG